MKGTTVLPSFGFDANQSYYRKTYKKFCSYSSFSVFFISSNYNRSVMRYRFGFNGMEADDEIKTVKGTSYDFGARMYDSRVGRWLRPDPQGFTSPSLSPYIFAANSPIVFIDPDGEKEKPYEKGKSKPVQEVKNTATPAYIYDTR